MPGLGASSKIFEYLNLPPEKYTCHYLEWLTPIATEESISNYAHRLSMVIKEPNPILIGVSFGGIIVQEIAQFLNPQKVIIISSVKSEREFSRKFGVFKSTKLYKLFPTSYVNSIGGFLKDTFGKKIKKRIELYEKYQTRLDANYLDWAFKNILHWEKKFETPNLYHIHGTKDLIFPPKYITDYIPIKDGSHIMILNKAKEISKILQELL